MIRHLEIQSCFCVVLSTRSFTMRNQTQSGQNIRRSSTYIILRWLYYGSGSDDYAYHNAQFTIHFRRNFHVSTILIRNTISIKLYYFAWQCRSCHGRQYVELQSLELWPYRAFIISIHHYSVLADTRVTHLSYIRHCDSYATKLSHIEVAAKK